MKAALSDGQLQGLVGRDITLSNDLQCLALIMQDNHLFGAQ